MDKALPKGSDRKTQNTDDIWPEKKDVIEAVGRAAGLLVPFVGVAYGAGLIIANADLSVRYSVVSFAFNRTHYVVVGFVWILTTALLAQAIALSALDSRPRRWTRCPPQIWRWLRFAVWGLLVSVLLAPVSGLNQRQSAVVVLPIAMFVCVTTEIASRARDLRTAKIAPAGHPDRGTGLRSISSFLPSLAGSLLLCMLTYSAILYPKLSLFFGGPDRSAAVLVLQIAPNSLQSQTEQLLSPIKVKGIVTEEVRVLWFDSDYVAIAPFTGGGKAILLNRTAISSIRYQ